MRKRKPTHVVTITMRFNPRPGLCQMLVTEVFSGSHADCQRVYNAMPGTAYYEGRKIKNSHVTLGTIEQWRDFLAEL